MNKKTHVLVSVLVVGFQAFAQQRNTKADVPPSTPFSNMLSIGLSIPVGAFSQSHSMGIGLDYSFSNRRFGQLDSYPLIKFLMNGGFSYYPGRKELTVGYESQYGGYFTFHATAGVDFKPADPLHVSLLTGPVVSLYKSNLEVGGTVTMLTTYYLTANISVGPGLSYRKFSNTEALWSASLRASYCF